MILLVGGEKGGSGKTTVGCNLAVWLSKKGFDTLVLDADPQASASRFFERRNAAALNNITALRKNGDLYTTILSMAERFDMIVIDTGGRDSKELRTAMIAADTFLIPTQPSQLDLELLPELDETVGAAKDLNPQLRARCVISRSPNYPSSSETRDAKALIQSLDNIGLCRQAIKDRKIYRDAFIAGTGVIETNNAKATAEIQLLAQELFEHATPRASMQRASA